MMVWDGKEHFLVFEILEDPHFFGKHNEKRWKEIGFKRFPKADYDAVSSEFENFVSGLS